MAHVLKSVTHSRERASPERIEVYPPSPGADSPEMPPILARKGGRVKEPDNYNIPSVITAVAF